MAEALPSASLPFRSLWFSAILPPLVLADHSAKVTLFGLVGSRSRSQGDDGRLCSAVSSTHHLCATSHLVSNDGIRGSPQKRRRAREELCYGRDDEGSQAGVVFPVPLELRRALHEGERAHREDRGRPRQPAQRGLRVCPLGAGSLERLRVQPQPPEEAAQARGRARRGQMEQISWDEAIATISDKWKEVAEKHGPRANGFLCGSGNITPDSQHGKRLCSAMGATLLDPAQDRVFYASFPPIVGSFKGPAEAVATTSRTPSIYSSGDSTLPKAIARRFITSCAQRSSMAPR